MKYALRLIVGLLCITTAGGAVQKDNEQDMVKTKSFSVNKGGMLEMSVGGGDIRIVPWEKNEVLVKVRGIDDEDMEDLKMSSSGNTVRIRNRSDWNNNYSRWGWSNNIRFEINVPSQFDFDLKTSAGYVEFQSAVTGEVRATTSAGDITLMNVTGLVDINTSGGDVRVGNVDGNLVMRTSGGDIKAGTVSGQAKLSTSGGNISIDNVKKTLWAKTSGGDVIIGDVGGDADISTSGGNIDVGKVSGSVQMNTAGGDIELASASGTVTAKTAGGNLHLFNITGSVEARTAGGDITAELTPGGKGRSKLSTASGEIRLYVAPNAKATIQARIRVQGSWKYQQDDYRIRSDFKGEGNTADDDDRSITGTYLLNGGGETITLETVNADIQIRKLTAESHRRE